MSLTSTKIQSVRLKGHQGAVLCLDTTEECLLLSGSEDGTARLWDLRSNPSRVSTCIVTGEEVTSVAFGRQPTSFPDSSSPPPTEPAAGKDGSFGVFSRDFTIYLSVGANVLAYDLRKATAPIIPEASSKTLVEAEDDINQIAISEKQRDASIFLAAADDTGIVHVLDGIDGPYSPPTSSTSSNNNSNKKKNKGKVAGSRQSKRVLLHHGQDTLVTSCAFRPRSKNVELASGGTDCQICLWDVNKPKKPLSSKVITLDQSGSQMCNPPMVHSLNFSPSGRLLASGLGDGTSRVFLIENRSLVEVARLQDPNGDTPVASVIFPSFLSSSATTESKQQHATDQDRLLALIRNDAVINFWDLGCTVAGDKAVNPSPVLSPILDGDINSSNNKTGDGAKVIEDSLEELSLVTDQPKLLFKIPHHEKPNWMASSYGKQKHFSSSIFVADTTSEITAYTIPII